MAGFSRANLQRCCQWLNVISCTDMTMHCASIPTPQPEYYRPMFGAFGRSLTESSVTFVSQAALEKCTALGLAKKLLPVSNTRKIGKHSMMLNSATPRIEVNSETYEVRADGRLITCEPARVLPMAQRYFMY